jgi:hypothetical protein
LTLALFWAGLKWPLFMQAVIGPSVIGAEVLLVLWSLGLELAGRRLLKRVPRLETDADLVSYRRFVRLQMYGTLVWGLILVVAGVLVAFAGALKSLSWVELVGLVPAFVVRTWSLLTVEEQLQTLPAANSHLEMERDRTVALWNDRPLPEWQGRH